MKTTITYGVQRVTLDPDQLSPTARALVEAVAATPSGANVDIWVEADQPIRDTEPDWRLWYTEDEAAKPLRRPWRGWSTEPIVGDPHQRFEYEASKIPVGWHILGASPHNPLPDAGPPAGYNIQQVINHLAVLGRTIKPGTWRSYVARGQAPKPRRWVEGGTPVWDLEQIEKWYAERNGGQP